MILDAGFLIAIDRGESAAQSFLTAALQKETRLRTTAPVMAQVWRNGSRQARLAKFLKSVEIYDLRCPDCGSPIAKISNRRCRRRPHYSCCHQTARQHPHHRRLRLFRTHISPQPPNPAYTYLTQVNRSSGV